jgi:hypothetical protein
MAGPSKPRAEHDAQRCLIEEQQRQIQRLERRIEALFRYTGQLQSALHGLNATPPPTPPTVHLVQGNPSNGTEHRAVGDERSSRNDQPPGGIAGPGRKT